MGHSGLPGRAVGARHQPLTNGKLPHRHARNRAPETWGTRTTQNAQRPPPRWAGRQRHRPPVSLWGISPHQLATGADRQLGGPRHSPDVSTAAADTTENCRHGDMSRQHDPLQAPICRKLSTSRTAHIISGQYDRPRRRVGCALQAIPGREEIRAALCGSESSRLNWLRGLGRQIPRCSVSSKNS